MSGLRTLLTASGMVGLVAFGYGMWALIAPGEERRRELVKRLPESNPMRMDETRKRNALVMQALKEAAGAEENIARGIGQSEK